MPVFAKIKKEKNSIELAQNSSEVPYYFLVDLSRAISDNILWNYLRQAIKKSGRCDFYYLANWILKV